MKIVIAPDKFKGSLTGFEFCEAVAAGLRMVLSQAEIVKMPLADGGDGTIKVVQHYIKGEKISLTVDDPLFRPITASYLYSKERDIAYIEMAEASGLKLLLPEDRNCMLTSSTGTGMCIKDALERGAKEIILGIGGSATNDGGMGMASILGFRFLDKDNKVLKPVGKNLVHIDRIDDRGVHPLLANVHFKVACDVTNLFYGKEGAAFIYAAQKGATENDIVHLDEGLRILASVVERSYGIDLQQYPGAGAAGGIGGGAIAFFNGRLASGIEMIKGLAHFDEKIKGADWIITGEGQLDGQTLSGKTIDGVVKSAQKQGIPVAAFCGSMEIDAQLQKQLGIRYATSILKTIGTLEEAMAHSFANLVHSSYNFAQLLAC